MFICRCCAAAEHNDYSQSLSAGSSYPTAPEYLRSRVSEVSESIQLSKLVKKNFKEERRRLRKIKKERLEARRTKRNLNMMAAVQSQVSVNETANSSKVWFMHYWLAC